MFRLVSQSVSVSVLRVSSTYRDDIKSIYFFLKMVVFDIPPPAPLSSSLFVIDSACATWQLRITPNATSPDSTFDITQIWVLQSMMRWRNCRSRVSHSTTRERTNERTSEPTHCVNDETIDKDDDYHARRRVDGARRARDAGARENYERQEVR